MADSCIICLLVSNWSDDDVINVITGIRRTADPDRMKIIRAFWERQEKNDIEMKRKNSKSGNYVYTRNW